LLESRAYLFEARAYLFEAVNSFEDFGITVHF
jgi:hypothetical protein